MVTSKDIYSELEWRGLIHQVTDDRLGSMLAAERFVLYCGFDPTADSLHLGGLIQLLGLRRMQVAGHRPIAVMGGGTGLIGDPSGRESERTLLAPEAIEANIAAIRGQAERIVDFSPGSSQAILVNNADWLRPLKLTDFLRDIGKHFSVNQMVARDSVRNRLENREQGISYTEFTYMLLQSYDFLHLHREHNCRLQIGGSDQWGNITYGIELIRKVAGADAYGLTSPLIKGLGGAKMGKSVGGNVWLDPARTSPYRFYQHFINVDDARVGQFLRFFTFLGRDAIDELDKQVKEAPQRREAQRVLAREVTALVHGPDEAARAERASQALFGRQIAELGERELLEVLSDAPSSNRPPSELAGGMPLIDLLIHAGLATSRKNAREFIGGGGVYVNNTKQTDADRSVSEGDLLHGRYLVLRRGKKNHHLVSFG
ncbi:MAG TPA: tyrosine--tRNA ligase [Actinomycetota bacterium]|nr:tyrosine--tRNA ligase [Actinomycetota bacterium]